MRRNDMLTTRTYQMVKLKTDEYLDKEIYHLKHAFETIICTWSKPSSSGTRFLGLHNPALVKCNPLAPSLTCSSSPPPSSRAQWLWWVPRSPRITQWRRRRPRCSTCWEPDREGAYGMLFESAEDDNAEDMFVNEAQDKDASGVQCACLRVSPSAPYL